jgi:hypothetical protein
MYRTAKNTAEQPVVTREARKWKSHANAAIRRVRSHSGGSLLEIPLTWSVKTDRCCGTIPEWEGLAGYAGTTGQGESKMKFLKQSLSLFLSCCLVLVTAPGGFAAQADQPAAPSPTRATPVQPARQTPEQLQQLVAPVALYPDALVAQILAAATYPDQVVEADRWLQQHTDLKGEQLGKEVDKQPWDPSVKALTEFPSVLANMDKNLSWTSSLGDAYVNQQQDVMNAVQVMRDRAEKAGTLKSTSQEKVSNKGQTIVIEPADPEVVYVPEYDPWLVYGEPIGIWPGWYWYPGLFFDGPGITFGFGFGVGFFGGFGWGWHHWGYDWHHHDIRFDHHHYESHSRIFVNRNHFNAGRGGLNRAGGFHGGTSAKGFAGGQHGFAGTHSGAFSGFNHGGVARGFSARGQSSFGGFHGGGGFHEGGGFHGGGGGRR